MAVAFKFEQAKAIAAIEVLVDGGILDLTRGKIAKLLFFADKRHLVQYGRPITGDWYAALPHGPLPSNIGNMIEAFENQNISMAGVANMQALFCLDRVYQYPRLRKITSLPKATLKEELSDSDVEVLSQCIQDLGYLSFSELRAISHDQPAYKIAWEQKGIKNQEPMAFEDFFEDDPDSLAGVKEEMIENCKMRQTFPEPVFD